MRTERFMYFYIKNKIGTQGKDLSTVKVLCFDLICNCAFVMLQNLTLCCCFYVVFFFFFFCFLFFFGLVTLFYVNSLPSTIMITSLWKEGAGRFVYRFTFF